MKNKIGDKQRLEHISDAFNKILLAAKGYDLDSFVKDFIVSAASHTSL